MNPKQLRFAAAAVIVILLFAVFGAYEYIQISYLKDENRTLSSSLNSNQAQLTSLKSQLQLISSPCAQKPAKFSVPYKLYPNGTEVLNISYPVFALTPGSVGTLCMHYVNQSNPALSPAHRFSAFFWNSSDRPVGISVSGEPSILSVPPGSEATVVYTVQAPSNSSTGYYALRWDRICYPPYELVVSSNPSAASFSDFPGLLNSVYPGFPLCNVPFDFPGTLLGFNGFTTVYLRNTTRIQAAFNGTSRSVVSVVNAPGGQNITFRVGIHSYSFPLTLYFATGTSTFSGIRKFKSNPQVAPIQGDACDWDIRNQSAYDTESDQYAPIQGITINAPTIQMKPFSDATFTFSMLISNLTAGYYVTFLGFDVSWKDGQHPNIVALNLGTYFPITVGSGYYDWNISGVCPPR